MQYTFFVGLGHATECGLSIPGGTLSKCWWLSGPKSVPAAVTVPFGSISACSPLFESQSQSRISGAKCRISCSKWRISDDAAISTIWCRLHAIIGISTHVAWITISTTELCKQCISFGIGESLLPTTIPFEYNLFTIPRVSWPTAAVVSLSERCDEQYCQLLCRNAKSHQGY